MPLRYMHYTKFSHISVRMFCHIFITNYGYLYLNTGTERNKFLYIPTDYSIFHGEWGENRETE